MIGVRLSKTITYYTNQSPINYSFKVWFLC